MAARPRIAAARLGSAASRWASTRSICAAASRWDPSRAAWSAAVTAYVSTVAAVAGQVRVVGDARFVVPGERDQVAHDGRVQLTTSYGGEAVEHRVAGQLVPVRRDPAADLEQVGPLALLEVIGTRSADREQQVELDAVGHHGRRLQGCPGTRRQTPRHGRPPRRGPSRAALALGGKHLGHEERVARGDGVDPRRLDVMTVREAGDRLQAQRREADARGACRAGEMTHHLGHPWWWVRRVLAVGQDQHGRRVRQPATEVDEQVERCLVGPVQVLDDDHGRLGEQVEQRREAFVPARVARHHRGEPSAGLVGDVVQRLQGTRRGQWLAGAEPHGSVVTASERAHQTRLADAGLATDEGDPAAQRRRPPANAVRVSSC